MPFKSVLPYVALLFSSFFCLGCQEESSTNVLTFNIEEATISEIHEAIRSKQCSCESLVRSYIERIETYDQAVGINSIVLINPAAMSEAVAMDKRYEQSGQLSPMHCIPLIVKDNYLTKGLQSTGGSAVFAGFEPAIDAYQVRKLKEAGAIVLAKSNMAEWAFSPRVTISSLAGETRNPYNIAHTTAGSSGGTAAAVAANFGAIGLGTDTGNSIRGPSSHNALVGFRSTLGLTSRHGIFPLYLRNDVGGPMARTVTDATKLLGVIAGYDPADPVTSHAQGKKATDYTDFLQKEGLQGARIGVLRVLSDNDPHPAILSLFEAALLDMKKAGATLVDPLVIPNFDTLSSNQWCPVFEHDLNQFLATLGDKAPAKTLDEIIATGKYAPYIEGRLQYFQLNGSVPDTVNNLCLDPYQDSRRIAFREAIEVVMDSLELDALVYPTWNHPPAKIGDGAGYKGDNSQVIAPHTGQPAFTLPMGFVNDSLPAGLQLLGRMYGEPTLIKLSYSYEQATQHRLNGPKVNLAKQ